ncbi:MAG TPA: hypothetical protein VF551_03775, partial [Chthoniobacterales bacterium]
MQTTHQTAPAFSGNVVPYFVMFVGLVLATFLGSQIGQTDLKPVVLLAGAIFALVIAIRLYRNFWEMALFLMFSSF